MREESTEVVVVGAGPVGLLSALVLAQGEVELLLLDREANPAARSYACALHPASLRLLHQLGALEPLLAVGHQVHTVAFFDKADRRAELHLQALDPDFPFMLILPQSVLESTLEAQLRKRGVPVHWSHRLDDLQQTDTEATLAIQELEGSASGYIVPHWETVVKRTVPIHARFVVGADGQHSLVRQRLKIDSDPAAAPELFAAYEFESDWTKTDEVRVVLDDFTTNVLWPLGGNRSRWTFQLTHGPASSEFPEKERQAVRWSEPVVDERLRQYVQRIAQVRAPWFSATIQQVTWCVQVGFAPHAARAFGREHCWLVGDAAHQTGPVGIQSMNGGFLEAAALAQTLKAILRDHAPESTLQSWDQHWRELWNRQLGRRGGLQATAAADDWVRQRAPRLLSCLPACGPALSPLAGQLHLEWP